MSTVTRHLPGTPAWFDLMTSDGAGARAFYGALFGWTIDDAGPELGHYGLCKLDGRKAAGMGQLPPGNPFPPSWTVYFAAESADAAAEAITAQGGQLMMPPMDVGQEGRMLVASDATGAVFGVWQPMSHIGAEVVGEPGAMAWCEVNTRDAARANDFYGKVFGLEARLLPGEMPTAYYTLHKGEVTACGVLQMNAMWEGVPPHWMPYFAVADTDKAAAKVAELGGKVSVPAFDTPYGRIAVVSDPQGAFFSIVTLPG